ncbi:MAG: hypothetical protein H7Y04_01055, partial [Verrucomicrobia bacterium]|nr:hypothetical protein [Cytophagales bacterium]
AEQAYKESGIKIIKPDLVFAVDPPLDFKRLYNTYVRSIRINPTLSKGGEAEFIINRFNQLFGGSPERNPKAYASASVFYRDAKDGGNARYLKSIPIRLYCDPDIEWFMNQRKTPIEFTNTADLSACIVQLNLLGNKNATLINCLGKGYLPNGTRHPHAFSMVDAEEFILWLNKTIVEK